MRTKILACLLILISCASPVKQDSTASRKPAGLNIDALIDYEIFRDYFSHESYGKEVGFGMDFSMWTDIDKEYLQKRADKAFKEALAKTFNPELASQAKEGEGGIFGPLKGNLINSFLDQFVKTLYIYKITDGTFQVDLHFSSKEDTPQSFVKELDNNQLIVESDSLKRAMAESKVTTRPDIAALDVKWPESNEPLQYVGGTISLWIKLLDVDIEFKKPIPTVANVVKGHIKYRRYFRVNPNAIANTKFSGKDIKINGLKISSNNPQGHFITVDIYKDYNLKTIPPKYNRMEIFMNGLAVPEIYKKSFIYTLFPPKKEIKETGKVFLDGELNPKFLSKGETFKTELKKLVFRFKDVSFTSQTEVSTDVIGVNDGPEIVFGEENSEKSYEQGIAHTVKKSITRDYAKQLISDLGLSNLSEELK